MINVLYNEYESDLDREIGFIESENDLMIDRAMLALETCLAMHELNLREAELTCMKESGDMNRLAELYIEADEGTDEKGKGLIGALFAAIANAFRKIKNALFGGGDNAITEEELDEAESSDEEVQVDKQVVERANKVSQALDGIKSFFSTPAENKDKIIKGVAAVASAAAITVAGVGAYKKGYLAKLNKKMKGHLSFFEKKADEISKQGQNTDGVKGAALKAIGGAMKGINTGITSVSTALHNAFKSKATKKKEAKDAADQEIHKNINMNDKGQIEKQLAAQKKKLENTDDPKEKAKIQNSISGLENRLKNFGKGKTSDPAKSNDDDAKVEKYRQQVLKIRNSIDADTKKRTDYTNKKLHAEGEIKSLNKKLENEDLKHNEKKDIKNKIKALEKDVSQWGNIIDQINEKIAEPESRIAKYNKLIANGGKAVPTKESAGDDFWFDFDLPDEFEESASDEDMSEIANMLESIM